MDSVPDNWTKITEQVLKVLDEHKCGPLDSFGVIFLALGFMADRYADEHKTLELNEMAMSIGLLQGNAMVKMNPRLLAAVACGAVNQLSDGKINSTGGHA